MEKAGAKGGYKLPGIWVFVPGLVLGVYLAAKTLLHLRSQLPSGLHFIWFVAPALAGAAALPGAICRVMRWKAAVWLAVVAIGCYWVPLFYYLMLTASVAIGTLSILGIYYLAPTLLLLILFVVPPTIAVARMQLGGVVTSILAALVCTLASAYVMPAGKSVRHPGNESLVRYTDADAENTAIVLMRSLNVALYAYAKIYDAGYVDTLEKLGRPSQGQPDANRADMFVPEVYNFEVGASPNTFTKRGYLFTYTPEKDSSGKVVGYSIAARPTGHGGVRSIYSDQTYMIRATAENRSAGPSDPAV
jgi:hypothetical protein